MNDDVRPQSPAPRQATAREFVAVVFRRKWVILGLFLATTATIVAITLATPLTWVSIGRVLIKRGERESALTTTRHVVDWKEDVASEIEVIKSYPVARRAQELLDTRAGTGGRKIRFKSGQIDVQVLGQSSAVNIAYVDADPEVAHQACDALIVAYVEHRSGLNVSYPKAFFEGEISRVTQDLNRWETDRRNFTMGTGLSDLEQMRNHLISYQMTLRNRLDELEIQHTQAESEHRLTEELSRDPDVDVPMLGSMYGTEPIFVDLTMKIHTAENRLATLRERYRDDAAEVVNASATVETLRGMLRREVQARVKMARSRADMTSESMAPLRRELAAVESRLASMPAQEARLNQMNREISVLRQRYGELASNNDKARINEQTSSNVTVSILAPAASAIPNNARDYVRLALAPAFSLVVGIGLAFFLDGLDSRLRTPLDVESSLDVPVLASITERRRSV